MTEVPGNKRRTEEALTNSSTSASKVNPIAAMSPIC
jgi:hypothetical protein